MLNKFDAAFGDGVKVNFRSSWPLDKTRYRLTGLTKWTKESTALEGSVNGDDVVLSVMHSSRSNGTAFRGQIKEVDSAIVLAGAFGSSGFSRAAGILGLAFLTVMGIGATTSIVRTMLEHGNVFDAITSFFIFLPGLLAFGALLIWNACPNGRDIATLTNAIENALGNDTKEEALARPVAASSDDQS